MLYVPINWIRAASVSSTLTNFKSSEGTIQADTEANGIIITDVPAKVEQIVRLIEKMDVPEKQVMIEARLVDITDEAQRNMGIDWTLRRVTGYDASKNPIYDDSVRVSEGSGGRDKIATSGNRMGFFGNDYDLAATLDFFERRNQATVLANPRVVTLNNLTAKIDILRKNTLSLRSANRPKPDWNRRVQGHGRGPRGRS